MRTSRKIKSQIRPVEEAFTEYSDLNTNDITLTAAEINDIESKIEKIGVVGDRYDALQQSRVEY